MTRTTRSAGDSALAALTFAFDDNITMGITTSVFRVNHSGTNGTTLSTPYEISYFNDAGVAQAYSDVSSQTRPFGLYSGSPSDYLLGHQVNLGDGATRIASIRLRVKHDVASDTLSITDSLQTTCLAIDDASGNINRTYTSGVLS